MSTGRPVSFWMRHSVIDEIDAAREPLGLTRSAWVILAIRSMLDRPPEPSPPAPLPD